LSSTLPTSLSLSLSLFIFKEFDRTFDPCVTSDKNGGCTIDYNKFHKTIPMNNKNNNNKNKMKANLMAGYKGGPIETMASDSEGDSLQQNLLVRCSELSEFYSEA